MQNGRSLVPVGFVMAVALVISTYLVTDAMRDIRMSHQIIKVRGYAETSVQSNLATWNLRVKATNKDIAEAYRVLAAHRAKVLGFLKSNGLSGADVQVDTVDLIELKKYTKEGKTTNETEAYKLIQTVKVKCADVMGVAKAATKVSDLLGEGVQLHAFDPRYYYTKVNDLKSSLLVEATKDARERARTLAEGSGVRLGPLRAARQGVFSIRAADSTGIAEDTSENTYSIGKKIAAVVTVDYAMK